MELAIIDKSSNLGDFIPIENEFTLTEDKLKIHRPDVSLLLHESKKVVAHCSLWWTDAPLYPGKKVGVIGHYNATQKNAGISILEHAIEKLKNQKCTIAVGPMDGNTWRKYRLITHRGDQPLFFLEPDNPDEWSGYFTDSRFHTFAEYYSALTHDIDFIDPRAKRAEQRLTEDGITIRNLDPARFDKELESIYELSVRSFSENLMYARIEKPEFLMMYSPIRQYIDPSFTLIAEENEHIAGFVFNFPDFNQKLRGEPIDTFIIKTIAVLPGRKYAGLGVALLARSHRIAREAGFKKIIHSLMYKGNISTGISSKYTDPFRWYTLFARDIEL